MFHKYFLLLLILLSFLLGAVCMVWSWQVYHSPEVVIAWKTASELDTVGFNVYRSDTPNGAYTQINPQLIPASLDPLTGGEYTYTDRDVTKGKVYYYQLEDIDMNGGVSQHGPLEVKAGPGTVGWEFLLAVIFWVIGIFGVFIYKNPRR